MKKLYLMSIALLAVSVLSSCAYFIANSNVDNLKALRINMTKKQVLKIMGEPVKNQTYGSENVWFYYVHPQWVDGFTTEDECYPLVFKNGKLEGMGWDHYEDARILHKHGK